MTFRPGRGRPEFLPAPLWGSPRRGHSTPGALDFIAARARRRCRASGRYLDGVFSSRHNRPQSTRGSRRTQNPGHKRCARALLTLLLFCSVAGADGGPPILAQHPAVSATQIVFSYAGDLWIVGRDGGSANRLTAGVGLESYPAFSPNGSQIAFAGEYEGNLDVYVIPAAGGVPRRLTYHPDPDVPVGWTPDGKSIIFRSSRASHARYSHLFTVPVAGGEPTPLPLPEAEDGSLSPDGKRIAYVPFSNKPQFPGGFRPVAPLSRRHRLAAVDRRPCRFVDHQSAAEGLHRLQPDVGRRPRLFPLRPRRLGTTLFAYDPATQQVRRLLDPGRLGHQVGGRLSRRHCLRPARLAEPVRPENREIAASCRCMSPRTSRRPAEDREGGQGDPEGRSCRRAAARAVFEARGEILTVPAEKGDIRNLTEHLRRRRARPGVVARTARRIAYFSDESGEYELCILPARRSR